MEEKQAQQNSNHDARAHLREFNVGQSVMARDMHSGDPWVPAVITSRLGPVTYMVRISDGRVWKRH